MTIPTKEKLAQKLHSLGLFALEAEARAGEFDDYENTRYALPKNELLKQLQLAAAPQAIEWDDTHKVWLRSQILEMIQEVMNGDWDNTREEGDAWFAREGKDLLG